MITNPLVDELERLFESLGDEPDRSIALQRVFALENPVTLEQLGNTLGLSRERIRQREARLRQRVNVGRRAFCKLLSGEVSRFANQIGEALPQGEALRLLPTPFSGTYSFRKITVQLVFFLYLAGPYELWGDLLLQKRLRADVESLRQQSWATLRRKRALTVEDADQFAEQHGITSPDIVNQVLDDLQSEHSNVYDLPCGKYVFEPRASDRAVRTLEERNRPVEIDQLARICGVSSGTLLNAISQDDRIVRLDRSSYGLRQWGAQEYNGIVGSIHKALELMGGSGPLEDVADWVTKHFDVSWNSVISYETSHHDFVTSKGVVRLRKPNEKQSLTDSRELGEVGDCLEMDGCPALRVMIDANLRRGSGRPVPRVWARKVGLFPGRKLSLGTGKSRINLSWVGNEPALGSLRAIASEEGWPQQGVGFLVPDGSELWTTWKHLPPDPLEEASAIARAMSSLFALPEPLQGHPLGGDFWMLLGERLGLQPRHRGPGMVLARLATRREKVVEPYVDALRQALLLSEAHGLVVKLDV